MKIELTFRKAICSDLDDVYNLFKSCVDEMITKEIYQWDDVYPNKENLSDDIERQDMYLAYSDDKLVAAYIINNECDEAYSIGNWKYPAVPFLVVHRLCVSPAFQHRGIAKTVMQRIEEQTKEMNIKVVRLDCYTLNPYSIKLYTHLGYEIVGTVTWRKGDFYLMEKMIS